MNETDAFADQVLKNIATMAKDRDFLGLSNIWIRECIRHSYAQNFSWLGRPIIQLPQDIYALQELIWHVKPDLIVETGIAHGGSLVMSASMLALLDYCEAAALGQIVEPLKSKRRVIGIDIDIRKHNRTAIQAHPLAHLIEMVEGSSSDPEIVTEVQARAKNYSRILVCLDSNHTHDHVLAELTAYAPLTSMGSYCIVWDTGIEDLPEGSCINRPWDKGNNPKTAVHEYLSRLRRENHIAADGCPLLFEIDRVIESKITITASPDGFLRRISVSA